MSHWAPFRYRPAVCNTDPLLTRRCRKCGAEFETRSRIKRRCDACQEAREALLQAREAAKRKARTGQ